MRFGIRLFSHFFFLCFCLTLFSCKSTALPSTETENTDLPVLIREESKEIDSLLSEIHLRSNVSSVRVFLNGEYQGNTALTLKNLSEGRYHLTLMKKGYESRDFFIDTQRGRSDSFYIPLELKKTGN